MATPRTTPIALLDGQTVPLFNIYSGTVTIAGEPAPNGTFIEARVRWWRSKPAKVFEGSYANLFVATNDWALHQEIITFHLGEVQAEETAVYNGRAIDFFTLNLTFP